MIVHVLLCMFESAKKNPFFSFEENKKEMGWPVIVRFYLNAYRDSPGLELTMRDRKWNFDYDRSLPMCIAG